jgi:hypothetical protein
MRKNNFHYDDLEKNKENASDSKKEYIPDPDEVDKVDDDIMNVDNEDTTENKRDTNTDDSDNDKYGDSPARGSIRSNGFKSSVAQAKQVNSRRNKFTKDVLSVGDICNIEIEGKIHGAEGPKYLPVAVMEVLSSQKGNISYKVTT